MKIGYARVSTADQNLDLQRDALNGAGCELIFEDLTSGATAHRPGLEKAREQLRDGDMLVVWRLDRLGRSLKDLIAWVGYLDEKGVGLVSLHESIDTGSSAGKLTFHLFCSMMQISKPTLYAYVRASARQDAQTTA